MLKKLSIFATLLIIIGVIGGILTYEADEIKAMNEKQSVNMSSVKRITTSTISTDVRVISSETATEATIELIGQAKDSQIPSLDVEVIDDELIVDVENTSDNKWFNINFSFEFYSPEMELLVTLPGKQYDNLDVSTVSGDVYIDNITVNNHAISTVSGDVDVEKLTGESDISTTSGDVFIFTKMIDAPILIETVSGDVEIEVESTLSNAAFNFDTVSGDINILDQEIDHLTIGNGTPTIEISTISGDIDFISNH